MNYKCTYTITSDEGLQEFIGALGGEYFGYDDMVPLWNDDNWRGGGGEDVLFTVTLANYMRQGSGPSSTVIQVAPGEDDPHVLKIVTPTDQWTFTNTKLARDGASGTKVLSIAPSGGPQGGFERVAGLEGRRIHFQMDEAGDVNSYQNWVQYWEVPLVFPFDVKVYEHDNNWTGPCNYDFATATTTAAAFAATAVEYAASALAAANAAFNADASANHNLQNIVGSTVLYPILISDPSYQAQHATATQAAADASNAAAAATAASSVAASASEAAASASENAATASTEETSTAAVTEAEEEATAAAAAAAAAGTAQTDAEAANDLTAVAATAVAEMVNVLVTADAVAAYAAAQAAAAEAAAAGAGSDPYVTTLSGITYKMADFTGFSRMLQGTLENKPFTLNTETTLLTKEELTDLAILRNKSFSEEIIEGYKVDEFPAYFSKLHASWGEDSVTIDLKTFEVTHSTTNEEYETKSSKGKDYNWSTKATKEEKMFIPFGPVTLVVKNIPNPDVRNGFTVLGSKHITDKVGALVKPMYVKDIKLKSLTSEKLIKDVKDRKPKKTIKQEFRTKAGEIIKREFPIY